MAILICLFSLALKTEASPTSLAEWTFPNNPDDGLVDTASSENTTELLELVGASSLTFNTSGATTNAARATNWHGGAESKYWFFHVNTVGYKNILVSAKLRSSSTGPRDFSLQYRVGNDGAWLDVPGGAFFVADNFTTGALEALPLPSNAEEQEALFLRLLMTSNQSVTGGVVTSTGANRLDDFTVTGSQEGNEDEEVEPGSQCTGLAESVRLNEILPYPALSDQEYAELFNTSDQCVNMSGWRLEDSGGHKYVFPLGSLIESGEYQPLIQNLFLNNTTPDTLTLYSAENEALSTVSYEKAIKSLSLSFDESLWRFTSHLTPGNQNLFDEANEEEGILEAGTDILLSEIFPNPISDEPNNEFIELQNTSLEEKNLSGWSLMDASGKLFILSEDIRIPPLGYIALPRSLFGFSLNNTGTETITLLEPLGTEISKVTYTTSQENFSYSFNGNTWQWTKKITPGTKNEFSKSPKIRLSSSSTGYVDIPLAFQVDQKNIKGPYRYSWDFGDGRRSTLAEPKHTFEKTGTYKVSVIIRSPNGIAEENFSITLKKYPKYPVFITALHPNPEGADAEKEWVEIKNFSAKKVDLTGWKIAAGSDELINHPLVPGITLAPHQTLRLSRRHAAFTLPNAKAVVELRYPNNDSASGTRYEEKEIPEGSTCINTNETCDFPEKLFTQKMVATKKKNLPEKALSVNSRDSLTKEPEVPDSLPNKKELLKKIGADFNLLINQILLDSLQKKE